MKNSPDFSVVGFTVEFVIVTRVDAMCVLNFLIQIGVPLMNWDFIRQPQYMWTWNSTIAQEEVL